MMLGSRSLQDFFINIVNSENIGTAVVITEITNLYTVLTQIQFVINSENPNVPRT